MNHNRYMPRVQSAAPGTIENEKNKVASELTAAIGDAQDVLVRAQTVFPLTLLPDTVTVDRTQLTVTHRDFFGVGDVVSIRLEDILNVSAHVGPFFGSLRISTKFFDPDKPYIIDKLWRGDTLKVKRIVEGYMVAIQKEVDCSILSTRELARLLDELGKVAPPEKV